MILKPLISRNNPLLKKIRLVSSGARRAPEALVLAEGIRVLDEVLRAGCPIEAAVCSERFGSTARERRLLEAWESRNVHCAIVSQDLFESISDVETSQGALALVSVPMASLADSPPTPHALILFACGIQDPGNLGTLVRTAAAAGASLVCTSRGTVSARSPKSIRSSAGAFFHLPPVEHVDESEFLSYCARNSIRLYRTDVVRGIPYTLADFRPASAVLLGNEGRGMAPGKFEGLPVIRIPMAKGIESLNVAAAGAVILFEASRQRAT
jgi:RNA methyltransferase, TrmH family